MGTKLLSAICAGHAARDFVLQGIAVAVPIVVAASYIAIQPLFLFGPLAQLLAAVETEKVFGAV